MHIHFIFKWNQANYIVHAMTNLKLVWQIVSEKSSLLSSSVSEGLEFFNPFEVIWGETVKTIALKPCYGYSGMYRFLCVVSLHIQEQKIKSSKNKKKFVFRSISTGKRQYAQG